ncbi:TetR/AcrR family transcriptional regulator [Streptomyces sp. SPB78]|uniref:TetR/AcrR family transcriptional regulator n=1 Tax=Streptomyces sp. (strain SPB78) TaxID=591157 RepID=UPI0002F09F60|nr:TetR/AcrR family transcriptional regulator [Streptomyces sp. SPB78]
MAAVEGLRERIVAAATELLEESGREAVTTRAVAARAGVQAPAIYRLFGDKEGLLHAVADEGLGAYLSEKEAQGHVEDPVDDLRAGWDLHVDFGLAHPALYSLMYADPGTAPPASPALTAAEEHLTRRIRRLAAAGRLRVGERLATDLVHASGRGTVLTVLAEGRRDDELLTRFARGTRRRGHDRSPRLREPSGPGRGGARAPCRARQGHWVVDGGASASWGEWLARISD